MPYGFKKPNGNIRQGQLIPTPLLAVYADEINLSVGINPQRNRVWEASAFWYIHSRMVGDTQGGAQRGFRER